MIKKIKAIELVFDWNLWPRNEIAGLNSTNLTRIKEAIKAGIKLPPVVANKKDLRLADGFHRVRAYLDVFGDDAEIETELIDFKSDNDIFLYSIKVNAQHGLPIEQKEKVFVCIKARKMKIPFPALAEALGMEVESVRNFIKERTAIASDGATVPVHVKSGLAGKHLTKDQSHYARTSDAMGSQPVFYAKMLLSALKAKILKLNKETIALLIEVRNLIDSVLEGAK